METLMAMWCFLKAINLTADVLHTCLWDTVNLDKISQNNKLIKCVLRIPKFEPDAFKIIKIPFYCPMSTKWGN